MSSVLEAREIGKSFGPVEVLRGIPLALQAGEVHAVIGENGAGKSTLMRILSGHLQPSAGSLAMDGQPLVFTGPVDAEKRGIVLVHQEILLAPDLTIAQNLFLGREMRRGLFVDAAAMNRIAEAKMAELGARLDPDMPVRELSIAQRQLVQIARALLAPHRVVIFDEPTATLSGVEAEALFLAIHQLKAKGVAVLYISHRLPEVKAIADRVTVLRDGRHVTTRDMAELDPAGMARLMVGRDMANLYPPRTPAPVTEPVLEARDIAVPGYVETAAFALRKGEILGFAGLIGAGRTELFEAIVGLRPHRGEVRLEGKPVAFRDAAQSMAAGIVYLSEDRKGKGLLLQQDLRVNLTLAALSRFARSGLVAEGQEWAELDKAIAAFDIRARRKEMLAGQLSGGNQQKLLLAKMMLLEPRIVVIDEPTRGIDIGTKEQIYRFIAELAAQGRSIVVISSEMPELIGLCHRVIVMRAGRIAGEVTGDEIAEDPIMFLATGVHEEEVAEMAAGAP